MIDLVNFSEGMMRLAVSLQKELDKYMIAVYYDSIADETTADEWLAFTKHAIKEGVFEKWMPDTTSLKEALYAYRRSQFRALPAHKPDPREFEQQRQDFRERFLEFMKQAEALAAEKTMPEAK